MDDRSIISSLDMGAQFDKFAAKDSNVITRFFNNPTLMSMMVPKTDLGPGYTSRYDKGTIPIEALQDLVSSPNFQKVDCL